MVRDLRCLMLFAFVALGLSALFFPSGCSSGGSSPVEPQEGDAAIGGDVTAQDAMGGNGDSGPGGCRSNADCAVTAGHVCFGSACVVCGANADCPPGQRCSDHTSCVACLTSADCTAGQRCVNSACANGCDAASTCPAGSVCDTTMSA